MQSKVKLAPDLMNDSQLRVRIHSCLQTADLAVRREGASAELRGAVEQARTCWIELQRRGDQYQFDWKRQADSK